MLEVLPNLDESMSVTNAYLAFDEKVKAIMEFILKNIKKAIKVILGRNTIIFPL